MLASVGRYPQGNAVDVAKLFANIVAVHTLPQ